MLVSAYTCSGRPQRLGGDIFLVELLSDQFVYPFLLSDMGNGSYSSNWSVTTAGQYKAFAYLAVPNGLRAEYFDNVWGLGQAKTIRIESQINLDAQLGPLTTSTGPDFAFIRWTGRLVSDTSEKYNITINSVGDGLGARLWFDGQLAIDAWDVKRRPLGERTAPPIALIAKRLYSLVLEVRISRYAGKGNRRDPAPQLAGGRAKRIALEWASASRPRTVINSSSFYYLDELNSDSPQNVTIVSAATSADYSYARGTGLISGKAGQPFEFEVLLTDIYGNRRDDVDANMPTPTFAHYIDPRARSAIALTRDAEHALSANASLFEIAPGGASIGSERLDVIFTDFDRKTAIVSGVWYPTIAGLYRLDILFRQNSSTYDEILFSVQKPIQDSPFYVTVVPASKALAANSYVHTRPHRSIAGEFATFQVVAVDALGNERRESGDDFTILARFADVGLETTDWSRVGSGSLVEWQTASHLAGDAMQLVAVGYVDDVGNGTYFLNVRPTIAGKHNVYITLRGLDIRDSPFTLNIEHADAHGAMSTAEGLGLTNATVNESAFVIATIRDAYGNPFIANATNILTCTIISEVSTNGTCETSLGNGSYVCSYVPIKSGWSLLSIQYGDQHFANSPFSVMVADAMPYGPTSNASGVGLRSAEAGVQATFDVTIRDVGGNIVNDFGLDRSANLTVTLNHTQINDANVIGSVLPLGAGLYRLTYTAIVSGFYDVYVREDDLDISGSPFSLFVEPTRVSAYHSIVAIDKVLYTCREHPVKVTAIDRFGNQLLNSTERVYAVIHGGGAINGSAGIFTETLRVDGIPLYDGHYDVSFWPRVAGKHSIELFFLEAGIDLEVYGEYDFTNFMGHRVDESIDFAWAGSGPFFGHTEWLDISLYDGLWRNVSDFNSTAMRTEMYSMRWKGKLQFESIRTYGLRAVIDEDAHASLFISSVDGFLGDGRETPALNVVVLGMVQGNRTILQSNTVLVGSFEPTGNGLHDFEFLYQHGRGIEASVRLEWRTSDDSDWITVPASAYIRPMRLANTTYYVDVTAGPTVASESTLVLTNNGNYDAGIWTDLGIVEIRDTCSNLRNTDASDAVAVVGYPRQYNNAKPIVAEITDLGNSTYQATALAKIAGDYTFVAVVGTAAVSAAIKSAAIEMSLVTAEEIFALNAAHVRGSPWTAHFAPGAIVASTSSLSGAALFRGVSAGSMARVLVTGRDATYNIVNKNVNASKFFVYLRLQLRTNEIKPSPSERLIQSVPILLEDGRVAFDFSLTIAGLYELSATYDGLALAGSPYPVDCLPSIANASTTAPIGALATMARANVAAEPSRRFFIRVRDEFHNDQLVGGQYFRVIVRGVITTIGFADDKDDGRYAITFSTANLTAGDFLVHVMLCDQANRGLLGHVFHNTGLQGKAAHIQIDDTFSLSYAAQPYTSIRWTGYLLAPDTAVFNFRLVLAQSADDAMLFIEDALVTATDTGKHSADGQVALSRNALYEISLEYRCTTASGGLVLQWSTDAVPPQPIPTYFLFPTASHIAGSPFPLRLIDDGGNASIFFESVWWGN
uniref:PA14 domain-containing protein n=1 Tax=Aureoumbra lagunensis TaxID=44058 RepID=A0A7S3JSX7_9STRA